MSTNIQNIVKKLGLTNHSTTNPVEILKSWEEDIDSLEYDTLGDEIDRLTHEIYNEYDKSWQSNLGIISSSSIISIFEN